MRKIQKMTLVGVLAACTVTLGRPVSAATITLFNDKDTEISSKDADGNHGDMNWVVMNWEGNARSIGLLEFDLTAIAPGSTINAAKLAIFHDLNPENGATFSLFRVTSPWSESTVTFNTAPTFDPLAVASLTFSGASGTYRTWDVTSLVQGWVSGLYPNYGFWFEEIPLQGPGEAFFASSDRVGKNKDPYLKIDVGDAGTVPEPASLLLFGMGLLGAGVQRWRQARA